MRKSGVTNTGKRTVTDQVRGGCFLLEAVEQTGFKVQVLVSDHLDLYTSCTTYLRNLKQVHTLTSLNFSFLKNKEEQ